MINTSSFVQLPYTPDLTEGGIAHALRSLPYSIQDRRSSTYDRLRCMVAEAVVEIAFRRYLSEQGIPFDVRAAPPFGGHDHYDIILGGRRCEIKSVLIGRNQHISQIRHNPELLLKSPVLVASDQHAAEGHFPRDLYLFAFLLGGVTTTNQPHYFIHVMPGAWNRPSQWNPLGKLVLKSEADETQTIEIGGQDKEGTMLTCTVEIPPRTRLEIQNEFFSLSYIHTKSGPPRRMGIHSPVRRETYLIGGTDWGNLWVYGMEILLAGYITREEFRNRASFIPAGSVVFRYMQTQVKNLAVPVSDLRPLSELLERVKISPLVTTR